MQAGEQEGEIGQAMILHLGIYGSVRMQIIKGRKRLTRYGSDRSYVRHSDADNLISRGSEPSQTLLCNFEMSSLVAISMALADALGGSVGLAC